MSTNEKFRNLKQLDLSSSLPTLVIVNEYKVDRVSRYKLKYAQVNPRLENRLRSILVRKISDSNTFEEYSFDCPEPEEDQVRTIEYSDTDFQIIMDKLQELDPGIDVIENVDELYNAKAYLIVLRNTEEIKAVGFKTLPENWKMKRQKNLISLLFKDHRFEDLEEENVFSISNTIDFIYYDDVLFILSKKEFERGLNFREGMLAKAETVYQDIQGLNIFSNMELLRAKVGNNQRYLRKIATIHNLGHYRDSQFLEKLKALNILKGWNIQFENGQIVLTEGTLEAILTIFQNKRLFSELTEEDFDVDSAKRLQIDAN